MNNRLLPEQRKRVVKLREQGLTFRIIGLRLGIGERTTVKIYQEETSGKESPTVKTARQRLVIDLP